MLLCVCSVQLDHRRRQNVVVRTSVAHSPNGLCATFLFLLPFVVICDLLLNRRKATWNLFVKETYENDVRGIAILSGAVDKFSESVVSCRFLKFKQAKASKLRDFS